MGACASISKTTNIAIHTKDLISGWVTPQSKLEKHVVTSREFVLKEVPSFAAAFTTYVVKAQEAPLVFSTTGTNGATVVIKCVNLVKKMLVFHPNAVVRKALLLGHFLLPVHEVAVSFAGELQTLSEGYGH